METTSGKEGTQRTRGSDDERHEVQINTLTESIGKTPEKGGPNSCTARDGDKKDGGGRESNEYRENGGGRHTLQAIRDETNTTARMERESDEAANKNHGDPPFFFVK